MSVTLEPQYKSHVITLHVYHIVIWQTYLPLTEAEVGSGNRDGDLIRLDTDGLGGIGLES